MESGNEFGRAISLLNRAAGAYFSKRLKPLGLGPGQQAYILALAKGERINQDTLAERLHVDKANVTRALAALDGLGYVKRLPSARDGRERLIELSPRGIGARAETEEAASQWVRRLQKGFSEAEWAALEALLARAGENATASLGPG
jgi:DNA-binding MarR family transcriptional regulator